MSQLIRYELQKILSRKITIVLFVLIFLATLLLNLHSLPVYSEPEVRWVDTDGQIVTMTVNPLEYIQIQRRFAMQWSGKKLDDKTIQALQAFLEAYDTETGDGYHIGYSYQNYYWVFASITAIGLNPGSPHTTEAAIQEELSRSQREAMENLQLTEAERAFWEGHAQISFPLTLAYTPAYKQLLENTHWIHMMLIFFVILALSESFSLDRRLQTRPILQATAKGQRSAVLARLLAGEAVAAGSALILYLLSALIQFGLFGMDGWDTPIQQINGYQWSSMVISAGPAVLLMSGTSMLLLLLIGALTMCISQLTQNGIAPLAVQSAFLLYTQLFEVSLFHVNRLSSQIWQYLPLQRIDRAMLYDERLVSVAGQLVMAIPFSLLIYAVLTGLFLSLCKGHTQLCRKDWL